MKIIDFKKHGDVVRFYLGADDCEDYWGDDWNDCPYEHNADAVYSEFVQDHVDYVFPFESLVLEPCDGTYNSTWCKEDMQNRIVPCIIYVPEDVAATSWQDSFEYWKGSASDKIRKFYFNDKMEVPEERFVKVAG